jgi:hypothetical protein
MEGGPTSQIVELPCHLFPGALLWWPWFSSRCSHWHCPDLFFKGWHRTQCSFDYH